MADYIERETVLNALSVFNDRIHGNEHFLNGIETAKEIVDKTLSADVAPVVHGKWVYDENGMDWNIPAWRCSECDTVHSALPTFCGKEKLHLFVGSKFCPQCGAKMDLLN